MLKYPRYKRSQDLRCKLTEKDIKKIRDFYNKGMTQSDIAKIFKVCQALIYYWKLTAEQRKERNRKIYLARDIERVEKDKKERQRKSHKRKYEVMKEFRDWHKGCYEAKKLIEKENEKS